MGKYRKMTIKMTYEVIILGHLHMPLYFIGTFTEYPKHKTLIIKGVFQSLDEFVLLASPHSAAKPFYLL